jgi:Lhr-like helicase
MSTMNESQKISNGSTSSSNRSFDAHAAKLEKRILSIEQTFAEMSDAEVKTFLAQNQWRRKRDLLLCDCHNKTNGVGR